MPEVVEQKRVAVDPPITREEFHKFCKLLLSAKNKREVQAVYSGFSDFLVKRGFLEPPNA